MIKKIIFWDSAGRIQPSKLYEFLHNHGVGLYNADPKSKKRTESKIVQVINNVVSEVSENYLMQMAASHIRKMTAEEGNAEPILDSLHMKTSLFSKKNTRLLQFNDIDFVDDTAKQVHFFYKNGVVKVTKDGFSLFPYSQADGYVWDDDILDRDFKPLVISDWEKSDFAQFINDLSIMGNDADFSKERLLSISTLIGYLLSRHKDPSLQKAIILMDMEIDGSPNGGSGKTLLATALSHFRKTFKVDGKMYDHRRWFKFSGISDSTRIILFDDTRKEFDFELLFSIMTSGIEIVAKYKDAYYIPFEKSPKVIITTNYALNGEGGSFRRRIYEYEVSNTFSDAFRPDQKFGKLFFEDWSEHEWQLFDNFMLHCTKLFLEHGLIESNPVNIKRNKFINATSPDFWDWVQTNIEPDVKYDKKILFESFRTEYSIKNSLERRKFSSWLEKYALYLGLEYDNKSHSDNVRYFQMFSKDENEAG